MLLNIDSNCLQVFPDLLKYVFCHWGILFPGDHASLMRRSVLHVLNLPLSFVFYARIQRLVEELLIRVHNQSQHLNSPSKGPITLSPSSQLTSSLIQEVNRACESLESMIAASMPLSPGHTIQLKALLSRLQATLPNATPNTSDLAPTKQPQSAGATTLNSTGSEVNRLASDLLKPGMTSVTSRLEIPAPRGKQLTRPDADTDRLVDRVRGHFFCVGFLINLCNE